MGYNRYQTADQTNSNRWRSTHLYTPEKSMGRSEWDGGAQLEAIDGQSDQSSIIDLAAIS